VVSAVGAYVCGPLTSGSMGRGAAPMADEPHHPKMVCVAAELLTTARMPQAEKNDSRAGSAAHTVSQTCQGVHLLMNKPPCCLTSTVDEQPQPTRKTKLDRQHALGGAAQHQQPQPQPQQQQQQQQQPQQQHRATVVDVLRANGVDPATTSAVGRLDFESSGALFFTSDG
jgi:16S rRNA U516 pseudouridylate synthase RsuA-like enzyme